ncbi:WDR36 protein, partial [Prunella fulvescens]|nr:WDR36 protein [Prunella fulvescens]
MAREGAGLFAAFRVLGRFSGHVPHVLRYHGRHREFYVAAAVGRSVHTYNVSNSLPEDITCLAADRMLIFASYDNILHAFARNKEVVHTYEGHKAKIHLLQPFGDHVISVDVDNVLIVWNIQSEEEYLQIDFDKTTFAVSALLHPSTYLNKILLGSEQGTLQLWNIRSNYRYSELHCMLMFLLQIHVKSACINQCFIFLTQLAMMSLIFLLFHMFMACSYVTVVVLIHNTAFSIKFSHNWLHQLPGKRVLLTKGAIIGKEVFISLVFSAYSGVQVWIFDGPGGTGRVLRSRMGHSAPPTKIRYHGQNGEQILSAGQDGTLQSFSTVHEKFNKSLGRGSINKKKSKKKGLKLDTMALPPITAFASEVAHQSDWDGIVACHQGYITCTTWNYQKTSMGAHKLRPEEFSKHKPIDIYATSAFCQLSVSSKLVCNAYGLRKSCSFSLNIQVKCIDFLDQRAHEGAIRGVAVDGLNQLVITAGSEGLIKFWKFKMKDLVYSTELSSSPSGILLHRDSGILGIAFDDFTISVLDIETRKIVRTFSGHHGWINDMAFSPDGRWLITSSMDCSIKTWDLPSGCLIDCLLVDSAAVSLTMSPTGDFLASAHVDDLGIYLW